MNYPKVAIVGRTNVGKSTLFNRLIESKHALVSNIPGTTRDRNIAPCHWRDSSFLLIDTGGLDVSYITGKAMTKNLLKKKQALAVIEKNIIKQTQIAVKQADLIIFVVDGSIGILPQDRTVLNFLRKHEKPFLLVANKVDNAKIRRHAVNMLTLGAGEPLLVSAASGVGCGDLLDEMVKNIPKKTREPEVSEIRVAILGKPNVGKSSLVNFLTGEERVIVTDMPHTTRESHDTLLEHAGKRLRLIDTAGIRKKAKVSGILERSGIEKTFESLKKADVVLFMVEINEPLGTADSNIINQIQKTKASVIIIANKWDLIPDKTTRTQKEYETEVKKYFPYISWAPILFMSAKSGKRARNVLDLIVKVYEYRFLEIAENELTAFVEKVTKKHTPKKRQGKKHPKILGMEQVGVDPPKFALFMDDRTNLHASYIRYIQNELYKKYTFEGTPLYIDLKGVK